MKSTLKRLLSLNLALVMVLMLLPFQALALNGHYHYHDNMFFDENATPSAWVIRERTLSSYYASTPTQPGWVHAGWSLERNGVPLTSTDQIPYVTASTEVNLYSCWAREQIITLPNDETVSIPVGPIQIGDELVVTYEDLEDLSQTKSGTGWTFSDGVLTLTEAYAGAPIYAYAGLILAVDGDVTIRATDAHAVYANKNVYFKANTSLDSSLTVIGTSGHSAMELRGSYHYAEYPFAMSVEAVSPALAMAIGGTSMYANFYYSISNSVFTNNQVRTATSSTSGSNLTLYRYIRPSGSTLSLTPDNPDQISLSLTLDPNGGTLPNCDSDIPQVITRAASAMEVASYNSLRFPTADTLPAPTRTGHLLLGWSHDSYGTYVSSYYNPGEVVSVSKADSTLYAIWQETPGEQYIFLDGRGEYIQNSELPRRPLLALPLVNGAVTLPDHDSYNHFVGWSKTPMDEIDFETTDMVEGLLYPGDTVSLPHGTTLYAVYATHDGAHIHGNGHTTESGNHSISVPYSYAGHPSDFNLIVYHSELQKKEFFVPNGEAILDLNTKADGSGESSYIAKDNTYIQWAAAPEGSILLYSHSDANADGRYGKLIPAEDAASFDLTSPTGFAWPGHRFLGWGSVGVTGDPLTQLPDPDQSGLVLLRSLWEPYTVTYVNNQFAAPSNSYANAAGTVTFSSPGRGTSGYTFNGWNTREDGTGSWYLPGQSVALTGDLTVYEQNLYIASGEASILAEDPTGTTLYTKITGTTVADDDDLTLVALPNTAEYWVLAGSYSYPTPTFFGFRGGQSYQLPKGCLLQLYDESYQSKPAFHGNGGTFAYGSDFRSLYCPSSFSDLTYYPSASNFTTTPANSTLGGWSEDAVLTETSTIYEPGLSVGYYDKVPSRLYAVWDGDSAAYITFVDKDTSSDRNETFTRRYTAGSTITLPTPQRLGYKLDGWSDGTTLHPAGGSYTVPAGESTLTAQWSARTQLMVNGVEYDPTLSHDYSNGETSGWKFVPNNSPNHLYLYNYNGGPIYVPNGTTIWLHGSNTVTGTAAQAAISGSPSAYRINIADNYDLDGYGTLTVQGGAGAPAITAESVRISGKGTCTFTGGTGAPAVLTGSLDLEGNRITLQGGAGAPAYQPTNSYSSIYHSNGVRYFAGADAASAVELERANDYTDQALFFTQPVYYTITLDAAGGTINGRSRWDYVLEYNDYFRLYNEIPQRKNATLTGWKDASGANYSAGSSFSAQEDKVLTAQWDIIPYERYLTLDCENMGTLNGSRTLSLELPTSGTITLPEPVMKEAYADQYQFFCWQGKTSTDQWVEVPSGVPVDTSLFESGMALWSCYTQNSDYILYTSYNGVASYNDEALSRRNFSSPDLSISRWAGSQNAEGLVVDSWNTKPDGSGTSYQPGDDITLPDGVSKAVLYAQWKPILTYTTKSANEVLPSWTDQIKTYVRNAHGKNITSLVAWRTADSSRFYTPGEACDLPAGTTLYAFCADMLQDANIWLYGNGATDPVSAMPSGTHSVATDETYTSWEYYTVLNKTGYVRPGYTLVGWNTKPDGSGTSYSLDHGFYYGMEYQDADGNWGQEFDQDAMALMPDALYAQWEKSPSAYIPVPLDMRQEEDAVIYIAIYDADGSFVRIQTVSSQEEQCALYDTEPGMTYQFLCLSDDSAAAPLTRAELGKF